MTLLLYLSYSSGLSKDNKLIIDKEVFENQEEVCIVVKTFASDTKNKTKKIIFAIFLGTAIYFSNVQSSTAISGLCPPVKVKIEQNYRQTYEMEVASPINLKLNRITFIEPRELPLCIYMMDERSLNRSKIYERITKIRGGGVIEIVTGFILIFIVCKILKVSEIEGFVNNENRQLEINRRNRFQPQQGGHLKYPPFSDLFSSQKGSTSALKIIPPSSMPSQQFITLTKQEKRSLPHPKDMKVVHEGHLDLEVGFWQAKFKVGDHGNVHNLPYIVKSNGKTKTEKTDANTLSMMKSIVDMPNRKNVLWFEDGTYQGKTPRGFKAILVYDLDTRTIAVYKKSTRKFVTTCQLDFDEHTELLQTRNFGGGKKRVSGQVSNLPLEQTPVNTFESDVTEKTPSSSMNQNSSLGFTSTNNFENDVMNRTPSQFDNP